VPATVRDVVFVDGVRTPFGKAGDKGMYAQTRADDMVVRCIRGLLERNPGLPPERIDEVAVAATTQTGDQGLTIGRTAALLAGLPRSVPGFAIDRMCAGAMTAVTTTASGIGFGAYDVAVAGGVEHMGHHPMGEGVDPNPRFVAEKIVDPSALVMGSTAENLHDRFPAITKERADAFAVASQTRLAAAYQAGKVQQGLVTMATRHTERGWGLATADEPPRPGTTVEDLAQLRTPFRPHGRVTAGNAAGLNDGATACLLAEAGTAHELGLTPRMRLVGYAFAGVDPSVMGIGPVPATEKALQRAGLTIDDIGLFEINEAFAVQVLAFLDHFGIADDDPAVNPWGGAIAVGHPLASSGVRLMSQLAVHFAEHPEVRYGLTTMCIGIGMGGTVLWENPQHAEAGRGPGPPRPPAPARRATPHEHRHPDPDPLRPRRDDRPLRRRGRHEHARAARAAGRRRQPGAAHPRQRARPHQADHVRPGRPVRHRDALDQVRPGIDAGEVRAVAITGKPFVFAVGADLKGTGQVVAREQALAVARLGHDVFRRLGELGVPSFAFVNGAVMGGGLEIALHCTHRTISSGVPAVALPECFLGLVPGWGGTYLLPRLVGVPGALTVMVDNALNQNRMLSGPKAFALGIADAMFDPADFLEHSIAWAGEVVAGPHHRRADDHTADAATWDGAVAAARKQVAVRLGGAAPAAPRALDLVQAARTADRDAGFAAEDEALADLIVSPQFRAGMYAFDLVQRRAKRPVGVPDQALARPVGSVGVVGAGLMASQLRLLFVRRLKVPVVMTDLDAARRRPASPASTARSTRSSARAGSAPTRPAASRASSPAAPTTGCTPAPTSSSRRCSRRWR
jgi:acetyl-CoA acyltransferase